MFTYRTVVLLPLIITATLSPKLAIATVASNERCEGLAIVWPPSKDPGSVYLGPTLVSSELWRNKKERTKSSYPRMGYLPGGTIIKLEELAEDPQQGGRLNGYCGFRFRSAIVGHIDREHIEKLDNVIRDSRLQRDDIGFISPADKDNFLELYKNADLSSGPIDKFTRNDRVIILFSQRELERDSDAIEVRYTRNAKAPKFTKAYVKASEDRAHNIEGTFRIFRPYSSGVAANPSHDSGAVTLNIPRYLEMMGLPGDKLASFLEKLNQYANIGGCDHEEDVTLDGGFKIPFFISVGGEAKIKRLKPKGQSRQAAGSRLTNESQLTLAGIVVCKDEKDPSHLESVEIVMREIGAEGQTKDQTFPIVSDNFFSNIDVQLGKIKSLKEFSDRPTNRHKSGFGITQMVIIPYSRNAPYWKYFDQFEDYMYTNVFYRDGKQSLEIDDEDRFGLVLAVGEVLTLWDCYLCY